MMVDSRTMHEHNRKMYIVGTKRSRGRPTKYWVEVIRYHMAHDITLDREMWRTRIRV